MTHIRFVAFGLAALAASGCASSLRTFGEDGTPTLGIPVATPVLVRITETTTFAVDPANQSYEAYCTEEVSTRYDVLAVGERIYVAFDPAAFGKGEFRLELTPSGALKIVSLNSDATAGADRVGDLLTAVLPFVASPQPVPGAGAMRLSEETAQKIKARYCIKTGIQVTGIERVRVGPAR